MTATHSEPHPAAPRALAQPERLRALRESRLLDAPAAEEFDRLTALLRRLLGVPTALVTLVDADRQFFLSEQGLAEPWASARETPLSHSFCQYVVGDGDTLSVPDARLDDRLRSNRAIEDLGVVSYLGVPLRSPRGAVLGAVCALDVCPRTWKPADVKALDLVAALAESEVALREALHRAETVSLQLRALNTTLEERIAERTAEVKRLAQALAAAEEEERARLARILHDDLQQLLYGVRLQLSMEPFSADDREAVAEHLARAAHIARSLSHDLAPTIQEDADLRAALHALADHGRKLYGLDVAVETVAEDVPLPSRPLQLLIGRVVKELLFNVAKHAGVGAARISGQAYSGQLEIRVEDDGAGFDAQEQHDGIGLRGLQERVRLYGGTLTVASAPKAGTVASIVLPLAAGAEEAG